MVYPKNLLQFFQLVPFPIANSNKSNSSMMPNVKEDLIAIGAEHQFQLLSQTDLQACQLYWTSYLCSGRHTTRTDLEDTCLGAYYLENWKAANKLCLFDFIPAKEHVYKMSSNKWIISSPTPFSTKIKCNKVFSTINLKALSLVTVPTRYTMHLKTHNIHPGSSISDMDMEVKHFQWKWDPAQMFPNFNTKAFNNTMNSIKETSAVSIDYINHEVNLKMDSDKESEDSAKHLIQELKEDIMYILTFYSIYLSLYNYWFNLCIPVKVGDSPFFPNPVSRYDRFDYYRKIYRRLLFCKITLEKR